VTNRELHWDVDAANSVGIPAYMETKVADPQRGLKKEMWK